MTKSAIELAIEALKKAQLLITDMSRYVAKMALQDYQNFNEAPIAINHALVALNAEQSRVPPDREKLAKVLNRYAADAEDGEVVSDLNEAAVLLRQPVAAEWRPIIDRPESDDLMWFGKRDGAGTWITSGPRGASSDDVDWWTHWAPCDSPAPPSKEPGA